MTGSGLIIVQNLLGMIHPHLPAEGPLVSINHVMVHIHPFEAMIRQFVHLFLQFGDVKVIIWLLLKL